jgi:hypothetical protein
LLIGVESLLGAPVAPALLAGAFALAMVRITPSNPVTTRAIFS